MFNIDHFFFRRLIRKIISVCFLWFDYWTLKGWNTGKVQNHFVSAYKLLDKWLIVLNCNIFTTVIFFSCGILKYVRPRTKFYLLRAGPPWLVFYLYSCYFCLILKIFTCCCLVVIYSIISSINFISSIIHFISIIIPETSWSNGVIFTVIVNVISITISRASVFSVSTLLIFATHDLNEALFLKFNFLFGRWFISLSSVVILPFTIYISL